MIIKKKNAKGNLKCMKTIKNEMLGCKQLYGGAVIKKRFGLEELGLNRSGSSLGRIQGEPNRFREYKKGVNPKFPSFSFFHSLSSSLFSQTSLLFFLSFSSLPRYRLFFFLVFSFFSILFLWFFFALPLFFDTQQKQKNNGTMYIQRRKTKGIYLFI